MKLPLASPLGSWPASQITSLLFTTSPVQRTIVTRCFGHVRPTFSRPTQNARFFSERKHGRGEQKSNGNPRPLLLFSLGFTTVSAALLTSVVFSDPSEKPDAKLVTEHQEASNIKDTPSHIRLSDVALHDAQAERKWVIHGTQVYDITDFIAAHPGGTVILRACGQSIDSYWKILTIHDSPAVRDMLKQYYIGDVHPNDLDSSGKVNWTSVGIDQDISDPFWDDPSRNEQLLVHTAKPCNAETPAELLAKWFVTPTKYFFVRNHLWVPRIEAEAHTLAIEFADGEEESVSLQDLKSQFEKHTITATLQCAGNRRKDMSESRRGKTSGLQWGLGAISTAEFTGVKLCDVLSHLGYEQPTASESGDKHIHFSSGGDTYSASIPLATALSPSADVLLVWEMNGEAISRDHGGPLRVLVPGTTAARSVKWIDRITLSSDESPSQWQQRDYKCFAPQMRSSDLSDEDWEREQSIQETPVQSAITSVEDRGDRVALQGFAFSGGGRAIVRVDVSSDDGTTWQRATISEDDAKGSRRWAWSLWHIDVPKDKKLQTERRYLVKAVDEAYNSQPETFDSIWNFRGLLANAWHAVTIRDSVNEQ